MIQRISTPQLAQELGKSGLVVIDVRPIAAFNGWPLQGEARGGHIRGAIACPFSWSRQLPRDDLAALLAAKGVEPEKTIVVYGYTNDEPAAMAQMLAEWGVREVRLYEAGLQVWAADDGLPMSHLPRYEKLVHPQWVYGLIESQLEGRHSTAGSAVYHVNFGDPDSYAQGHIPGAMHLDTNALESPATWNRRPPEQLESALRRHGITRDKTIILYGRDAETGPRDAHHERGAGQMAAARAALILRYAGVEDVRLLDGGFGAWLSAGYPLETGFQAPTPVPRTDLDIPERPELLIGIDAAKALLVDPDGLLASVRSWPEFIGEESGYEYIDPKGRIPGAVWGNRGSDAFHTPQYRNFDNTMRDYHEIEANWEEVGIVSETRVAFYCGTGWRASEAFFYAHLMGWERIAVYDGGWLEWSRDERNPIERGG